MRILAGALLAAAAFGATAADPATEWRDWPPAANPAVAASLDNADPDRDGRLAPIEFNNIALGLASD